MVEDVTNGAKAGMRLKTCAVRANTDTARHRTWPLNVPDGHHVKRFLDVVVSATLLIVLMPLLLVVALAIVVDDGRPIFYRGRRVGHRGQLLHLLKFRKMTRSATGSALTVAGDRRFTRVGRFLAATKLDELPQLWNVLSGEMSLVGPRPEDPSFVTMYSSDFERVLAVKPGITGLSQLAFQREAEVLDVLDREADYAARVLPQKIGMDLLYAERRTFGMDLRILMWTFFGVALHASVAVDRRSGRLGWRRRPAERAVTNHLDLASTAPADRP